MKIYVGGKYHDAAKIKKYIEDLKHYGFEITHDWTSVEQHDRSIQALGQYAKLDIQGVSQSDIVILIMDDPKYAYRGTFTELGCALGLDKSVVIVNPNDEDSSYCATNCFYNHPDITHIKTWREVKYYLSGERLNNTSQILNLESNV